MKRCGRCGEDKAKSLFGRNRAAPDGLYSLCRVCKAAAAKARRARPEVKEREKRRLADAYQARKSELKVARRQRYLRTRAATLTKNREWQANNRERQRAACREWAKANPLKMRAIVATRRALARMAEGRFTKADVERLFVEQGGRCKVCTVELHAYHVDHVVPLSRGGSNWPANLQLLCPTCNRRKGAKLPTEFGDAAQREIRC